MREFAEAFESGRDPDPGTFLARADAEERGALADRLDAYLDEAPGQSWDPGVYERSPARMAADSVFADIEAEAGGWPELLPKLRERARISREQLTAKLAAGLGFGGQSDVNRVHAYYHQMETGRLEPARVSDRVLDVLAGLVGSSRETLRAAGEHLAGGGAAPLQSFARTAIPSPDFEISHDLMDAAPAAAAPAPAPKRDELDELFLGPKA